MKKTFNLSAIFLLTILFSAFTWHSSVNWTIEEGYEIKFSSKNPTGIFTGFEGDINWNPDNPESSSFNVTVDAASINTGNGMKNKHAKSDKWFNVDKYPKITFKSESVRKTEAGYEVTGKLNLVGVEKSLTFPFEFENNTFSASFKISRKEYNLGQFKGMQAKAAEELQVDIKVPVKKS